MIDFSKVDDSNYDMLGKKNIDNEGGGDNSGDPMDE